jgi:predicted DNA-binding transcriptional regulator YafY
MAKKRSPRSSASKDTVALDRAIRLHQLVKLVAAGPQSRDALRRLLRIDVRGFYRDLVLLRRAGIDVGLNAGNYLLKMAASKAFALLPFPDPHLTLGEAMQLSAGQGPAQRKLKTLLARMVGKTAKVGRKSKGGKKR